MPAGRYSVASLVAGRRWRCRTHDAPGRSRRRLRASARRQLRHAGADSPRRPRHRRADARGRASDGWHARAGGRLRADLCQLRRPARRERARQAHRPVQPAHLRAPHAAPAHRSASWPSGDADEPEIAALAGDPRYRPLQAHQRHLRSPLRRRGDPADGPADARQLSPGRRAVPLRRRGVRGAAGCRRRGGGTRGAGALPRARRRITCSRRSARSP